MPNTTEQTKEKWDKQFAKLLLFDRVKAFHFIHSEQEHIFMISYAHIYVGSIEISEEIHN